MVVAEGQKIIEYPEEVWRKLVGYYTKVLEYFIKRRVMGQAKFVPNGLEQDFDITT